MRHFAVALIEAMQTPLQDSDGGGFVRAGVERPATIEVLHDEGRRRETVQVEVLPGLIRSGDPVGLGRLGSVPVSSSALARRAR
ncbi:MAG: hypothetical protein OXF27_05460 [Acidobacteria bacterium]|nr:hypothetical protein [Acidobacteriota bacterium]